MYSKHLTHLSSFRKIKYRERYTTTTVLPPSIVLHAVVAAINNTIPTDGIVHWAYIGSHCFIEIDCSGYISKVYDDSSQLKSLIKNTKIRGVAPSYRSHASTQHSLQYEYSITIHDTPVYTGA